MRLGSGYVVYRKLYGCLLYDVVLNSIKLYDRRTDHIQRVMGTEYDFINLDATTLGAAISGAATSVTSAGTTA